MMIASIIKYKMKSTTQFDWYSLSKMNTQRPLVDSFAQLIKHAHLDAQQLSSIPTSHRRKLLVMFQACSNTIKTQYEEQTEALSKAKFEKKIMRDQINAMKNGLQVSLQKLTAEKLELDDNKKTISKLKEKLEKKKSRGTEKQVYYCPVCAREDFSSRQAFSIHIFNEHLASGQAQNRNKQQEPSITNEVKQLILSLKDKEIELMEMMLNKKKEMENQELEKAYEFEIKKIKTQANFMERKSQFMSLYQNSPKRNDDELQGNSQYLFYQNDLYNRRKTEQYSQASIPQSNYNRLVKQQQSQPTISFDRKKYYNIFESQVNESQRLSNVQNSQYKISQSNPQVQNETSKKHEYHQNEQADKNLSWDLSVNKPLQYSEAQQQSQSRLYNYSRSRTDRNFVKSDAKMQTGIYRTSQKNYSNQQHFKEDHIFNSGPLMEDAGDGSDYDDYFGAIENQSNDEVDDEQIVVHKRPKFQMELKKESGSHNQSNSNMVLEYSKDRSSLDISSSKLKSSEGDLSNSFSKHAFDASKSDDTINLSDLKLSKLQRERQRQKQQMQREELKQQNVNAFKKQVPYSKNILDEFKVDEFKGNENQPIPKEREDFLEGGQNRPLRQSSSKRSSVLEQFMRVPSNI